MYLIHLSVSLPYSVEQYLLSVLSTASLSTVREQLPLQFPVSPSQPTPTPTPTSTSNTTATVLTHTTTPQYSTYSTYTGTLEQYMYRNNLHRRLGFLTRIVPIVQVDIYGLQEILAVRTISATSSAAQPVAIPSGVSPLTYIHMINKGARLTPTATTHTATVLDIYAVMKLSSSSSAQSTGTTTNPTTTNSSTTAPTATAAKPRRPLSMKYCPIGGVVTAVHKAEARRTPLEQTNTTTSTSVGQLSGVVPNWFKQQQQGISRSVEFSWREQAIFRFPLPEGQHYTYCPDSVNNTVLHTHTNTNTTAMVGVRSSNILTPTSSTATLQPTTPPSLQPTTPPSLQPLPPTILHIPSQYFEIPTILDIAVYERTFFTDTLLGELHLSLAQISGKK